MKINDQLKGINIFISHAIPSPDKSFQKIQLSRPPQDDNAYFKVNFAYFYPTKFALM